MSLKYSNGKWHIPPPTGDYAVGYTDIMTGPGLDGCFFRLFYPADVQDVFEHHDRWASWIPHPKYTEGYAKVLGFAPFITKHIVAWAFRNTHIPVVKDANPAKGNFPVMVFSHGLAACRTSYSYFCSDIASHGFVVAAIEHRDNSACASYSLVQQDAGHVEEWVDFRRMRFQMDDYELRQVQLEHRIQECVRTLDMLHEINNGDIQSAVTLSSVGLSIFQGLMDLSRIGLAGHSFGGATLLRTLAVEKRFKFGIVLDSWLWPLKERKDLPEQVDQPLLFINMEAFQTKGNLKFMNRFLNNRNGAERRVITLRGSVHQNQCDVTLIVPGYLGRFTGSYSAINPHFALTLNNRLSLLFMWKHNNIPAKKEYEVFVESESSCYFEGISGVE